jgi:hypothetical protein
MLLGYRGVSHPLELLEAIRELWAEYASEGSEWVENSWEPVNASPRDHASRLASAKQRIYVFIIQWILYWGSVDFQPPLPQSLLEFLAEVYHGHPEKKERLTRVETLLSHPLVCRSKPGILPVVDGDNVSKKRSLFMALSSKSMGLSRPGKGSFSSLMSQDSSSIAEQLTVIESELVQDIHLAEFLDNNWQKEKKRILAPALERLSGHFNRVSLWVATAIVTCPSFRRQVKYYCKFIRVAQVFSPLKNFNYKFEKFLFVSQIFSENV